MRLLDCLGHHWINSAILVSVHLIALNKLYTNTREGAFFSLAVCRCRCVFVRYFTLTIVDFGRRVYLERQSEGVNTKE